MKYLQDDNLTHWTGILTNVAVGHSRVLNGRVEAYSMKRAGSDKKYAATLGEKFVEQIHQDQEMAAAKAAMPPRGRKRSSSVGILQESTLDKDQENAGNKHYDFGSIKASDFVKVKAPSAIAAINHHLAEWARNQQSVSKNVLEDLWESINEAVPLKDCDVYRFVPPDNSSLTTWEEEELLEDENTASTNLWSFYYLFVNKTTKRILLFTATESMIGTTISDDEEDVEERYIGVTEVEPDGRFDLDPEAATPGGIPISSI